MASYLFFLTNILMWETGIQKKSNQFILHCKRQILHGQMQLLEKKKTKQKPNQSNKQTRNWFNENFWYFIIYFYLILIMKITTSYQKDVRPTAWRLQFDSGRHRFKILIHILHKPRTFQISSCMSHFLHQCSNWWFLIVVPPVLIFLVLLWISS